MEFPNLDDHLSAFISTLTSNLPATVKVGDGEAPRDGNNNIYDPPYAVVTLFSGGFSDGPLTNPQVDPQIRIQLTAVGRTQTEAARVLG